MCVWRGGGGGEGRREVAENTGILSQLVFLTVNYIYIYICTHNTFAVKPGTPARKSLTAGVGGGGGGGGERLSGYIWERGGVGGGGRLQYG